MKYPIIFLSLLLGIPVFTPAVFGQPVPNFKIGINRVVVGDAKYSHDSVSGVATGTGNMTGNDLLLEYIMFERFGFEVTTSLTPAERNYSLASGGTTISSNVSETVSVTTIGVNLYFDAAFKKGTTLLIGIGLGPAKVTHEFEGGTLGTTSSTNTINLNTLKIGFDWVTELATLRLQYQNWNGRTSSTSNISNVLQTVDLGGNALVLGVLAFF